MLLNIELCAYASIYLKTYFENAKKTESESSKEAAKILKE